MLDTLDRKIKVKNPGCKFCRYFLAPFKVKGKMTPEACLKGAKRIYHSQKSNDGKKIWKWNDCAYSKEKNKDRYCSDFQVETIAHTVAGQLSSKLKGAGQQMPPTFSKEKWWKT